MIPKDELHAAAEAIAWVANEGEGCMAADEMGKAPCCEDCECLTDAIAALTAAQKVREER